MTLDPRNEQFEERRIKYMLEVDGQFIIVENVPAHVNVETGEQLFSPDTVERLQRTIWEQRKPERIIQLLTAL